MQARVSNQPIPNTVANAQRIERPTDRVANIPLPTEPPANPPTYLERDVPLSQSLLWQLQSEYYTRQGVDAWVSGAIPHYITSNPLIAGAYTEIVAAYIDDIGATPERPLRVLELGAGHGRFAYLFLQQLDAIARDADRPELVDCVRYIMSDCVEANLIAARKHPLFESYITSRRLLFARFDATQDPAPILLDAQQLADEAIDMVHSYENVEPLGEGPLCVIANYVLDSLAADAFRIQGGQLKECLLSVRAPQVSADASVDSASPDDPGYLEQLQLIYSEREVDASCYYPEAEFNEILNEYSNSLGNAQLLLPVVAMRCLDRLRNLSDGRFLLLSADKGVSRMIGLQAGYGGPGMSIHGGGCFSVMVNYHAIGREFELAGGQAHHPARLHENLNISCCTMGEACGALRSYKRVIRDFGPDDFFSLSQHVEQHYSELTVAQMLAYLRLSRWDAKLLGDLLPALTQAASTAPESVQNEVLSAVTRCRRNYFPLRGETQDVDFLSGGLLFELGFYAEAIPCFEASLEYGGPAAETYHNLGICYKARRDLSEAVECFAQALAIDPGFDAARRQRIAMETYCELNGENRLGARANLRRNFLQKPRPNIHRKKANAHARCTNRKYAGLPDGYPAGHSARWRPDRPGRADGFDGEDARGADWKSGRVRRAAQRDGVWFADGARGEEAGDADDGSDSAWWDCGDWGGDCFGGALRRFWDRMRGIEDGEER